MRASGWVGTAGRLARRRRDAAMDGVGERLRSLRRRPPPLCFRLLVNFYHRFGVKHALLVCAFLLYALVGALVFVVVEEPHQRRVKHAWLADVAANRSLFVRRLMPQIFNNSRYFAYVRHKYSGGISAHLERSLQAYEGQLGIKYSDQKMDWDYWNAVLYAGTISTTIGYGHIYPRTAAGRILTMVYAIGGIPLVLLLLQDFGKLLTVWMKYPWFQFKRALRRILRYCTQQKLADIEQIEKEERHNLAVFDLPIPVAVALIVLWVFLGSAIFAYTDSNWTYLESFYFFFISLSTIGLGDLVPQQPKLLLMMFMYIIMGLSLVSMVVSLLQTHLQRTYEAGRSRLGSGASDGATVTLGVLGSVPRDDRPTAAPQQAFARRHSRASQTALSLPVVRQAVLTSDGVHWLIDGSGVQKSPDEVMRLVETDADAAVLRDLGERLRSDGASLVLSFVDSPTHPPPVFL